MIPDGSLPVHGAPCGCLAPTVLLAASFSGAVVDLGGETVKGVQLLNFEAEVCEPGSYV